MKRLALIFALAACGTSGGGQQLTIGRDRTVASKIEAKPAFDYQSQGRAVPFGKTVEIIGADTVWIQGEKLLVTVDKTSWETLGDQRASKARFKLVHEGEEKVITIEEGRSRAIFGYTLTVEYAFESYSKETLQYVPHVKIKVTK